ncbi:MAG: amylo-alpha-1,6-glucosidase [Pseudomonadota bacterium]|nr:amylo-alpha-1,6-glucosidase [Pseudomonadota bacterium]
MGIITGIDQGEARWLSAQADDEWLEVNGRGGYASSTLQNCHTRKYHGLLVAQLAAPPGRYVLLSKFEDTITCGRRQEALSRHRYPGVSFPAEYSFFKEFQQDLYPSFLFAGGGLRIVKSVLLAAEEDCLLIRYDPEVCPTAGTLRLRPFLAYRDCHRLSKENPFLRGKATAIKNGFSISPYAGMPPLVIQTNLRPRWQPAPLWYRNFEYAEEAARGYEHHEDLFSPGFLETPLRQGKTVLVLVSLAPFHGRLRKKWDDEARRRREDRERDGRIVAALTAGGAPAGRRSPELEGALGASGCAAPGGRMPPRDAAGTSGESPGRENDAGAAWEERDAVASAGDSSGVASERELLGILLQAGRRFLIRTPTGQRAIIAGYPWFGEWGRDALISLPGLAFCSGRLQEGLEILVRMTRFERQGLLPNVFSERRAPDDGDHAYNAVDAPLWFFWAVQQFLLRDGGDRMQAVVEKRLWPTMKNILRRFINGTLFNISMDVNGLIHAGAENLALTWMDACIDSRPVTPRHGCPVEVNALWYNAVCFAAELASRFGDGEFFLDDLVERIRRSFPEVFWNDDEACLGDVYRDGRLDRSIRPNQIFAVSLPHSPLTPTQARLVVKKAREELLTPVGLRTLSPRDPLYRGRYAGSPAERDGAYHQGTVWPWLWGPFGEAWLKVAADREAVKKSLRDSLHAFLTDHFRTAGIGCISEVFDGDSPHRPGGCIAQAWSTAEIIRLYSLIGES